MLKRRNLEAPQDSRSCCFARAEDDRNDSPSKTNMPHMSIDNSDLSDPFGIDMDLAFDGLSSADHQYPDFDQSFPYAISEPGDPFQLLEPEAQSPAMPPDIFDQSPGPSVTRGLSAMDIVAQRQTTTVDQNHDDYFDFDKQDEMPNSISYRQTQPGQQNRPCHNNGISDNLQSRNVRDLSSASACAFGWPNIFDPNPAQQHRLQSPSSAVGPNASSSSSPTSSGMQTTIRLEGADQSTLSAVIGTLIETKAKFRLETH